MSQRSVKVFLRENLGDLLKEKEISQSDLAFEMDVSLTSIQRWKKGSNAPEEENLEKLVEILELDMEEIKNYKRDEIKSG